MTLSVNSQNTFASTNAFAANTVKAMMEQNPSLFTGITFNGAAPTAMYNTPATLNFGGFNFANMFSSLVNLFSQQQVSATPNYSFNFGSLLTSGVTTTTTTTTTTPKTTVRYSASQKASNPIAQKAVETALSQVGVREIGNTNNGAEVNEYRNGVQNGVAWCASFTSWCYGRGQGSTNADTFGYTAGSQVIKNKAIRAGYYSDKNSGYVPQVGDIAVWTYSADKGHVGIIAAVNEDGTFEVVEGNSNNAVRLNTRSINDENFNGFVRMNEWLDA